MPISTIRSKLNERADELRRQLEETEVQREELREAGRSALNQADMLLQSVEVSLANDSGSGSLSARRPSRASLTGLPLPPIQVRPDSAT